MTAEPKIKSRRDRRLEDWISRSRGDGDLVVLDGVKLVREALQTEIEFEALLLGDSLPAEVAAGLASSAKRRPLLRIESRLEKSLTGTSSPRGAILVVHKPATSDLRRRQVQANERAVLVVLVGVQDPGNAGSIIRVAEAAGSIGVALSSGSARAFSPRAVRASAGSVLRLPIWEKFDSLETVGAPDSFRAIALDADADRSITDPLPSGFSVLVAGSEGNGLSGRFAPVEARRIPMAGGGSSLSVLSAVSVALWVLTGYTEPSRSRR